MANFNLPNYQTPGYSVPTYQNQGNGIIWVNGEAEAKAFMLAPNSAVALWDRQDQTIYLKTSDASGMINTKILDYTVRETPVAETDIHADYLTKADFEKFAADLQKQLSQIANNNRSNYNNKKYNNGNKED